MRGYVEPLPVGFTKFTSLLLVAGLVTLLVLTMQMVFWTQYIMAPGSVTILPGPQDLIEIWP